MNVKKFQIDKNNPCQNHSPSVRVVLDGSGCGSPGCRCSPDNFIMISDGEIGLTVALSDEQAAEIRKTGVFYTK